MITSHHSFSTRLFHDQTPAHHASAAQPVAEKPDNLREFWWFLRGERAQNETRSSSRPRSGGSPTLQKR